MAKNSLRYPSSTTANYVGPHKKSRSILITAIVAISILAAVMILVPAFVVGMFSASCTSSDSQQQKRIDAQQKGLAGMTIIDDQTAKTEGQSGGDCLTGGASTAAATANFTEDSTAAEAQAEVKQNLEQQGFKQSEPLVATGSNDDMTHSLEESYAKSSISIDVSYSFAQPLPCDKTQALCNTRNVAATGIMLQTPVDHVSVYYHDDSIE